MEWFNDFDFIQVLAPKIFGEKSIPKAYHGRISFILLKNHD